MAKKKPSKKKASKKMVRETVMRNPSNYVKIYATRIRGGLTSHDFRFELMNEKVKMNEKDPWTLVSDGMVILSPIGAKRFLVDLQKSVEEFERINGPIPLEPKKDRVLQIGR